MKLYGVLAVLTATILFASSGRADEGGAPCSTGSVACPSTCTIDPNSCKPDPNGGGQTCIMVCKNRTPAPY